MNRADADRTAPDLAALAGLLADGTRASICLALLDGRWWTAKELALAAGVAASTATGHLNLLVTGGLLTERRQGRHRYLSLADADTAELIENLASMAPGRPPQSATLRTSSRRKVLARARTCYDHLAGSLGVAITQAMTDRGFLDWQHGLALTADGRGWLAGLGIAVPETCRRPPVRSCLDWTERRPHLAGAVGAAICRHAFDSGWIERIGTGRAVAVTGVGRGALREHLALRAEPFTDAGS